MEIGEVFGTLGVNPLDLIQHVGKIKEFLPKIKDQLPKVHEFEKTLGLKQGEKVIYTAMVGKDEIFIYVYIARQIEVEGKKLTVISDVPDKKLSFKAFEQVEKILSYVPV